MQDLSYLSLLDDDSFERERARLIRDHIMALPEDRRRHVYAMQCKIDTARMTMSSQEFLCWMAKEAGEQADNLLDALGQFRNLIAGPPTVKPASER